VPADPAALLSFARPTAALGEAQPLTPGEAELVGPSWGWPRGESG
jgi:hypothetical protein